MKPIHDIEQSEMTVKMWQFFSKYLFSFFTYLAMTICILVLLSPMLTYGQSVPLVEIDEVKPWEKGAVHQIHCIVEAPEIKQFSSHYSSRLVLALPDGSQVKKGQVIAHQDSYYIDREIEQLEIELQSAIAQEEYTHQEFNRIKQLNSSKLVSSSQHNDVSRQAKQATLSKKTILAKLKELTYRQNSLTQIAPTDGQIFKRQAILGQNLNDGEPILQFLPDKKNELMCEMPLPIFRQSQQLTNVQFTHAQFGVMTLNRQSQVLDEKSQMLKIYLDTSALSKIDFLVGERIKVNANYTQSALTRVPLDAIELAIDAAYVWAIQAENKVAKIPVEIVETQKNYFLVSSNLKAGDYVITIGKQGLQEQQQVKTTGLISKTETKRTSS